MTDSQKQPLCPSDSWSAPRLVKLGTIADVANGVPSPAQGSNNLS